MLFLAFSSPLSQYLTLQYFNTIYLVTFLGWVDPGTQVNENKTTGYERVPIRGGACHPTEDGPQAPQYVR